MSKTNSEKYSQFGRLFGRDVHMLETSQLDPNHKLKEESVSIKVPAVLCTIKSIKVNTLRQATLPGGIEAVIINGGEKELSIGLNEEIIMSAAKFSENREKKAFFGSYRVANDLANTRNRSEISRLKAIINDCSAQVEALENIIDANERALSVFDED